MTTLLESTATISPDGVYRYDLVRRWELGPLAVWVMLNPSTADDVDDDPTIRRCTTFSQREGAAGLVVVNLFALRATDPKALARHNDPVGPDNQAHLERWLGMPTSIVSHVIGAWGDSLPRLVPHPQALLITERHGRVMQCLGRTRKGRPRHPLYLAQSTPLELYT